MNDTYVEGVTTAPQLLDQTGKKKATKRNNYPIESAISVDSATDPNLRSSVTLSY